MRTQATNEERKKPEQPMWRLAAFSVCLFLLVSFSSFLPARAEEVNDASDASVFSDAVAAVSIPAGGEEQETESTEVEVALQHEASSTIATGDAVATLSLTNNLNVNVTTVAGDMPPATTTQTHQEVTTDASEATEQNAQGDIASADIPEPLSVSVESDNTALLSNEALVEAETGDNETIVASQAAHVASGDAHAVAQVANMVNTNILNSNGFIHFLHNIFEEVGTLDLRVLPPWQQGAEGAFASSTSAFCSVSCGGMELLSQSTSTARVVNNIIVRSQTGGNVGESEIGSAMVESGEAIAAANVVTLANTNIVDSNYLLLVFNNFGNWVGDFIFPSESSFSTFFRGGVSGAAHATGSSRLRYGTIRNDNEAVSSTTLSVLAETGSNEAHGGDGALVTTGNGAAIGNVLNVFNRNVTGGSSLAVALRVHGAWEGSVYSVPHGVRWEKTNDGIILWNEEDEGDDENSSLDDGPREASATSENQDPGSFAVTSTAHNRASIENNVSVFALTGENRVASVQGKGEVATGNAYAAANIVNIANTNIIGSNWILALIDIFGNWTGNIAFGQPDLWLGGRIEMQANPLRSGNTIDYHFTIANRGDTAATQVQLATKANERIVWFPSGTWGGGTVRFDIGTIPAGGVVDVVYHGAIREHLRSGASSFFSSAVVSSYEPDANQSDNTEQLGTVDVFNPPREDRSGIFYDTMPLLAVSKSNNATTTLIAPGKVDYEITIWNDSIGSAYDSILHDVIKNEKGTVIHEETWNLGQIYPHEEIKVTYSAEFNASTTSGVYTNFAYVEAWGGHALREYARRANSPTATSSVTISGIDPKDVSGGNGGGGSGGVSGGATPPAPSISNGSIERGQGTTTETVIGLGGLGIREEESVGGAESDGAREGRGSIHDGNRYGSGRNGGALTKVVELHPLAVSPVGEVVKPWWERQGAAVGLVGFLNSPILYAALLLILLAIFLYEKRNKDA